MRDRNVVPHFVTPSKLELHIHTFHHGTLQFPPLEWSGLPCTLILVLAMSFALANEQVWYKQRLEIDLLVVLVCSSILSLSPREDCSALRRRLILEVGWKSTRWVWNTLWCQTMKMSLKTHGGMSEGHRSHLKGAPKGQSGTMGAAKYIMVVMDYTP